MRWSASPYQDVHGAAATNVFAARNHYTVEDPYERADTPETRPTFGRDDGEIDGIVPTPRLICNYARTTT